MGALFIIILGTLMHFAFEWAGGWKPLALFAAVNESVWEHLKLAFWPAFLFAILECVLLRKDWRSFFIAKAASFYVMPATIMVLFYTYTGIIGFSILAVDISTFVIAALLGQYVSYRIMVSGKSSTAAVILSLAAILLITLAFSLFTFYPPHIPLFKDPVTGGYGI